MTHWSNMSTALTASPSLAKRAVPYPLDLPSGSVATLAVNTIQCRVDVHSLSPDDDTSRAQEVFQVLPLHTNR